MKVYGAFLLGLALLGTSCSRKSAASPELKPTGVGAAIVESSGGKQFGIGVGTLVLAANVVFLSFYTLGCHSFRHIVGGFHDELSKHRVEQVAYDCASCLNRWHMRWAWTSLIGVAFADLYVRMCAMGMWHDWRIV